MFVTFISEFENTQTSFSCGPPFGSFWFVKHLSFWLKATNLDNHHTFLKSTPPEVTKNLYYDLTTRLSQISIFRLQLRTIYGTSLMDRQQTKTLKQYPICS